MQMSGCAGLTLAAGTSRVQGAASCDVAPIAGTSCGALEIVAAATQ